eukprot:54671-Hanusia_phi.AAC.1
MPPSQLLLLPALLSASLSLRMEGGMLTQARLSSFQGRRANPTTCGRWRERTLSLGLRGGGTQNYYKILGLDKGSESTAEEIKKAYKKMALRWHPDRCDGILPSLRR